MTSTIAGNCEKTPPVRGLDRRRAKLVFSLFRAICVGLLTAFACPLALGQGGAPQASAIATKAMQPPPLLSSENDERSRLSPPAGGGREWEVETPANSAADANDDVNDTQSFSRRRRPGDDLVNEAALRISQYKTIQAMLRQQVRMFGQTLVGSGAYRQSRQDSNVLLRMDLQLQLDDRAATYQQISDGRFLWKFEDSPDIENLGAFKRELSRVDLDVIRRAKTISDAVPSLTGISYGGLPQLMHQLGRNFTFGVPQTATLHDVQVWVLNGSWYEPALKRLIEPHDPVERAEEGSPSVSFQRLLAELPAQFPHHVSLAIGKDDLFPYRIEYRRSVDNKPTNGIVVSSNSHPIVTLELFQVQFDALIDPSQFVRRAGDLPVQDVTSQYLEAHGLEYRPAEIR